MSLREQYIALMTLLRKEIRRFLRIWKDFTEGAGLRRLAPVRESVQVRPHSRWCRSALCRSRVPDCRSLVCEWSNEDHRRSA